MRIITVVIGLLFVALPANAENRTGYHETMQLIGSLYQTGHWIYIQIDGERDAPEAPWKTTLWASTVHAYDWGPDQADVRLIHYAAMPDDALMVTHRTASFRVDLSLVPELVVEQSLLTEGRSLGDWSVLESPRIDLTWIFADRDPLVVGPLCLLKPDVWATKMDLEIAGTGTLSGSVFGEAPEWFQTRATIVHAVHTTFPYDPSAPQEP